MTFFLGFVCYGATGDPENGVPLQSISLCTICLYLFHSNSVNGYITQITTGVYRACNAIYVGPDFVRTTCTIILGVKLGANGQYSS